MSRAWMLVGLVLGCGPVVTAGDGDGTSTGAEDDDDDRGDDRPVTGASPTMTTSVDDEGDESDDSDVDDGWHPDFGQPSECSDGSIADCYAVFTHDGYSDDVERITVADVDLDGWLDLVGIGDDRDQMAGPTGWIFVHPGQGESWGERTETWMSMPYMREILIVDLVGADGHGDGKPDLVGTGTVGESPGGLIVAPGDGDGHFAQWAAIELPDDTRKMRAADVDGDGALEVITTFPAGQIAIVHSFDPMAPEVEILEAPIGWIDALEVGSLGVSGEGVEILVAGSSGDQHSFAVAQYDAAVAGQWVISALDADAVAIAVRDYTLDGTTDLATASGFGSQALMYGGSGDGALDVPTSVDLGGNAGHAAGGQFGPTAQGLAALVDGTVTIADFESGTTTVLVGPAITGPFMAEDINQDGLTDIVAPVEDRFNVVVFLSHL